MPHKILVVEGHGESAAMLETLLQGNSYETVSARNGLEAYALAVKDRPDLVLTELSMPGLDGVSLVELLRADLQLAPPPILVVTGHSDDRITRALEAGATAWLSKPIDADLLKQTLSLLLR